MELYVADAFTTVRFSGKIARFKGAKAPPAGHIAPLNQEQAPPAQGSTP